MTDLYPYLVQFVVVLCTVGLKGFQHKNYEVTLPFEWVAALDNDEERVTSIHHHWGRMQAMRDAQLKEQSDTRRKKQLLDRLSADDKALLGIKE